MILFRTPVRTFGRRGVLPAGMPTAGDGSPLLNDTVPGDEGSEFLWTLLTPLVDATSNGTTTVDDTGAWQHVGADDGSYTQDYRILVMPPTGATVVDEATISFTVGATGATVNGQTLTNTVSLIAGTSSAGASVDGQVLSNTISLTQGDVTGGSTVNSITLTNTVSLAAGSASGAGGATVDGQTLTNIISLVDGQIWVGSTVDGQTLTNTISLFGGGAFDPSVIPDTAPGGIAIGLGVAI